MNSASCTTLSLSNSAHRVTLRLGVRSSLAKSKSKSKTWPVSRMRSERRWYHGGVRVHSPGVMEALEIRCWAHAAGAGCSECETLRSVLPRRLSLPVPAIDTTVWQLRRDYSGPWTGSTWKSITRLILSTSARHRDATNHLPSYSGCMTSKAVVTIAKQKERA